MVSVSTVLITVSAVVLALGLFSALIKRVWFISTPLIAVAIGVALGPAGFNLYNPLPITSTDGFVEEVTRVALALAIMSAALRIPWSFIRARWRILVTFLVLVMLVMWLISTAVIYAIIGGSFWFALLIGSALTPTDPVIAAAVLEGGVASRNVPPRLRHLLTFETGINDGLAYPFVLLPLLVLTNYHGSIAAHWIAIGWLYNIGGGVLFGALLGLAVGWLTRLATESHFTEHASLLGITLALTLLTLSVLDLTGANGFVGTFAAGTAFNIVSRGEVLERQQHVEQTIEQFFDLPIFVLLGMLLPWQVWITMGWRAVVIPIAILLARRVLGVLAIAHLVKPTIRDRYEALYIGWFGPIGISSLFYAALIVDQTHAPRAWAICTLVVLSSVVVHGLTATPLTRLMGRRMRRLHRVKTSDPQSSAA